MQMSKDTDPWPYPSHSIMQPNMNPQTQSRAEKLPALTEMVLWVGQYEKENK